MPDAALSPAEASRQVAEICAMAPVIPVLVIDEPAHARPLAEALVAGGLPVLEVTLRTSAALEAISVMAGVPGAVVGAGTLLDADDVAAAQAAGARFGVAPGSTPGLLSGAERLGLPLLPGAATASEMMALLARGYRMAKFFPAEPAGGVAALKALGGPLPQLRFCPTGGVGPANAASYLALDNVVCVGGSWVAPRERLRGEDWAGIRELAMKAASLAGEVRGAQRPR